MSQLLSSSPANPSQIQLEIALTMAIVMLLSHHHCSHNLVSALARSVQVSTGQDKSGQVRTGPNLVNPNQTELSSEHS